MAHAGCVQRGPRRSRDARLWSHSNARHVLYALDCTWRRASRRAVALVALVSATCVPVVDAVNAGTNISLGTHPNFATLLYTTSSGSYICGGWLADARHIVTAAHCVTQQHQLNDPAKFFVYFNKLPGVSPFRPEPSYQAQALFAHPGYGSGAWSAYGNDVGIVRLAASVPGVTPWSYATSPGVLSSTPECTRYTVVGHGETCDGGCLSAALQRGMVFKLADAHCERSPADYDYRLWPPQVVGPDDVCMGNAPPCVSWSTSASAVAANQHACAGDSGGPVFDASGTVVALVSRGSVKDCSQVVKPDVYTHVGAPSNAAWIASVLSGQQQQQPQTQTQTPSSGAFFAHASRSALWAVLMYVLTCV